MIAKNHEKIFETVYADLIAALKRSKLESGAHPYALYLGNWMADFSQLYSPDLPNMLIELLDLPDTVRSLAADALAFLDAQQKALPATIAAAVTKAWMDKTAVARAAANVQASPYRNEASLEPYADYLRAAPSALVTPRSKPPQVVLTMPTSGSDLPMPFAQTGQGKRKKAATAHSTLLNIARRQAKAQAARSPGSAQPDAASLVATLVEFMLTPVFDDLRNLLKTANRAADVADEVYRQFVKRLEALGFVDKFNGTAELAIWLLGLFKFSNPAHANETYGPILGTGGAAATTAAPSGAPTYATTPQPLAVPPSIAAELRIAGHIPPNVYSELFGTYFGFYKPYEHLDRFMDAGRVVAKIGGSAGAPSLNQKRAFRHYRKDNYPLLVTPIASLKGEGLDLDSTLWRGMQIAYGRLLAIREAGGDELPINDRLLLIGRSFHAFEDYFAHTNFVDRLIYSMQLEHSFHTHPFELKKILLSVASEDAFNALEADKALFGKLDCADETVRKVIEAGATECVKSGFYDTPDAIHSLVHMAEGVVKHALEMEDEQRDIRFDLYDALEKYALSKLEALDKVLNWTDQNADLLTVLTKHRDDIFLDSESFAKIAGNNALLKSMGSNGEPIRKLINFIFWLILAYYTAKHLKDTYVAFRSALSFFITILKFVKTLYFTPNVVIRYLRIAFSSLPEPIRDELIALAIEAFREVCRVLASILFAWIDKILENNVHYGSHSLMAKDEATHQDRLYALAEQFGILIDKAALEFVFAEPAEASQPPPPDPRGTLERLLDGFAYNPLSLKHDALVCVSHGLLTRCTLAKPQQTLDTYLKACVQAYLDEDKTFEGVPAFALQLVDWLTPVRWATAMRTMVRLNADRITLIVGKDPLYLSDATFKLLKSEKEVELIVWKVAQTPRLKASSGEIVIKPWTVKFVDAFMSGKPIDWKDYRLAELTAAPSSGTRSLPANYRTLADQFIRDYSQIWQNILIIPGTLGDAEWAMTHDGDSVAGWL